MQPTPPPHGPQYGPRHDGGFPPGSPPAQPAPGHPPVGYPGYPPLGPGHPAPSYPPLGPGHPAPSYPPLGPGHPAPGYPPLGPGYPPGPFGYPQPPQPPKSTAGRWPVLAAVVLLVVLAGGSALWWFGRGGSATTAAKPDITTLSETLLLGRDRFTAFAGNTFESLVDAPGSPAGNRDGGTDQTFAPEECGRLGAPDETQTGGSSLSGSDGGDHFDTISLLSLTAQRFDPTHYLDRCARYTSTSAGVGGTFTMVTLAKRVNLPGVPDWAIAYTTTIEDEQPSDDPAALYSRVLTVQGYRRGVLVSAIHHELRHGKRPGNTTDNDLVALFNAQVAKLAAAP